MKSLDLYLNWCGFKDRTNFITEDPDQLFNYYTLVRSFNFFHWIGHWVFHEDKRCICTHFWLWLWFFFLSFRLCWVLHEGESHCINSGIFSYNIDIDRFGSNVTETHSVSFFPRAVQTQIIVFRLSITSGKEGHYSAVCREINDRQYVRQ